MFPTEVSCNIPNVGAAGNEQAHNGLCVLTQVRLWDKSWSYNTILEHHQREDVPGHVVLVRLHDHHQHPSHLLPRLHSLLRQAPFLPTVQDGKVNIVSGMTSDF